MTRILWHNVWTAPNRWMAAWLRRRGWVCFHLDPQARVCRRGVCWLALYEEGERRDRRLELNREEAAIKAHALTLMHTHGKTIYRHDGIEIRVIDGEEDVKVKVKKPTDEDADRDGSDDGADA